MLLDRDFGPWFESQVRTAQAQNSSPLFRFSKLPVRPSYHKASFFVYLRRCSFNHILLISQPIGQIEQRSLVVLRSRRKFSANKRRSFVLAESSRELLVSPAWRVSKISQPADSGYFKTAALHGAHLQRAHLLKRRLCPRIPDTILADFKAVWCSSLSGRSLFGLESLLKLNRLFLNICFLIFNLFFVWCFVSNRHFPREDKLALSSQRERLKNYRNFEDICTRWVSQIIAFRRLVVTNSIHWLVSSTMTRWWQTGQIQAIHPVRSHCVKIVTFWKICEFAVRTFAVPLCDSQWSFSRILNTACQFCFSLPFRKFIKISIFFYYW